MLFRSKIKEIFEKYNIKTIYDLKTYVFKIKTKFSLFKKKEKKGNIIFISNEASGYRITIKTY